MKWLTSKEFAKEIGITEVTMRKYRDILGVKFMRKGHTNYYPKSAVKTIKRYIKNNPAGNVGQKELKPTETINNCPRCGSELFDLGSDEKRCPTCDRYFKGKKEIKYTDNGDILFK